MSQKKTSKRHSAVPPTETAEAKETAAKKKVASALTSATVGVAIDSAEAKTPITRTAPVIASASTPIKQAATPVATPGASDVATPSVASAACTALIAEMRGSDADAARDAASSLGHRAESAAVIPLMEVLDNREGFFHGVVRAAAASSLAQIGDKRAVESLINAINDPMAETSAEAVRALSILADARAVAPLIDVIQNTDGFFLPIVRRAAVIALAHLGGEKATAALRAAASNEMEDNVIRHEAEQAITRTASAR